MERGSQLMINLQIDDNIAILSFSGIQTFGGNGSSMHQFDSKCLLVDFDIHVSLHLSVNSATGNLEPSDLSKDKLQITRTIEAFRNIRVIRC